MTDSAVHTNGKKNLLEIKELVKYFPVRGGLLQRVVAWVQAVDNISFNIREGETVGLVGESGCGKTTVGRTLLRLIEPTSGNVLFDGVDVAQLKGKDLKAMRRNMQIIFQDPYASLDPRMPIGESISEGLKIHNVGTPRQRFETTIEMLRKVGMEDYHARRYPHEFSGGQRQRLAIDGLAAILERSALGLERGPDRAPVPALDSVDAAPGRSAWLWPRVSRSIVNPNELHRLHGLARTVVDEARQVATRGVALDTSPETASELVGEFAEASQDRSGLVLGHARDRREFESFVQVRIIG